MEIVENNLKNFELNIVVVVDDDFEKVEIEFVVVVVVVFDVVVKNLNYSYYL